MTNFFACRDNASFQKEAPKVIMEANAPGVAAMVGIPVGVGALFLPAVVPVARPMVVNGASWAISIAKKISPFHGIEFNIKNNLRIKPLGFWSGERWAMRLPHVHRRIIDKVTGETQKYQGIGKHRPWETIFRRWFR